MVSRIVRVQAAIVADHHILLIQHREHAGGRAYWLLPGGGIEADETEEICLRREVREETHLEVAVERLLLDGPAPAGDYYQRFRTYLCRPLGGEPRPGHEPEPEAASVYAIAAVQWLDLRDERAWDAAITTDSLTYSLLKQIQRALGYAGGPEGTADSRGDYLLASGGAELERLRLQARVWEPEAEAMLDRIAPQPGWHCADLGCGAMGILGPLSRRVGPAGWVTGVDRDAIQLAAARAYVHEAGLANVEILDRDAYDTGLPRGAFDLVHVRFVFAPVGRDEELLREMLALARPGAILAIQEPDATSWNCFPPRPAWDRLKAAILAAFARGGGDFNAGQRTYTMLRAAGLEAVRLRAAVIALHDRHPYMRLPIQFATSLRHRILEGGLLAEAELDDLLAECERIVDDPDTFVLSFVVTQAWGRKPGGRPD